MEFNLRRYEAMQRLLWFVFFLLCLGLAHPLAKSHQADFKGVAMVASIKPEVLKSSTFLTQTYWLAMDPLGGVILYVLWVAVLFLAGKFLWLLLQYIGRLLVKRTLVQAVRSPLGRPKPVLETTSGNAPKLFPAEPLLRRANSMPLRILFHPFQRLQLMLSNHQHVLSADELTEKERRIVDIDWQVFASSWTPLRWLLWLLPALALVQTGSIFYQHLAPALTGQIEIEEAAGPLLASLLPLGQSIAMVLVFNLLSGLLKRLENLYLSNVDAIFYDQFVSRVPFQSSDTVVILEALQKQFKEIQTTLRRIEAISTGETNPTSNKR